MFNGHRLSRTLLHNLTRSAATIHRDQLSLSFQLHPGFGEPHLDFRSRLCDVVVSLGCLFPSSPPAGTTATGDRQDEPIFSDRHRRFGEFIRLNASM